MKKLSVDHTSLIEGGGWFKESVDFAAGACTGFEAAMMVGGAVGLTIPGLNGFIVGFGVACVGINIVSASI